MILYQIKHYIASHWRAEPDQKKKDVLTYLQPNKMKKKNKAKKMTYINGSMQKTPKSWLLENLETRVISEPPSNFDTLVIDGLFFLRPLKDLPETFGLLAKTILKKIYVLSNDHCIDSIFDKTILPSIIDCERWKIPNWNNNF